MTATSMWVSIPTSDIARSTAFYEALGFRVNPLFSDDSTSCIVLDEHLYFMLVTPAFLATMTDKTIIDPTTHAQVGISLTRDSREAVDEAIAAGLAAGGTEPRPAQDYGFMYSRDLDDPSGNNVGFFFMDATAAEQGPAAAAEQAGASA